MGAEGLKIKLAFTCGTENSLPMCLVQDDYGTTSITYTLVACYFVDIDQDSGGGDVIGGNAVWGRLGREGM